MEALGVVNRIHIKHGTIYLSAFRVMTFDLPSLTDHSHKQKRENSHVTIFV